MFFFIKINNNMTAYDFLIEKNLITSKKEFQELYLLRCISHDNQFITEPNKDISSSKILKIGIKELTIC